MKKIISLAACIAIYIVSFAQAPQKFNYQGIARDTAGNIISNKTLSFRLSILQTTTAGASVYIETQTATADTRGIFSLEVGGGTIVSGTFSSINWGGDSFYLKTEMDPAGGTNYTTMGTTQMLSVPYSQFSNKAGNVPTDGDTSATNELQALSVSNDTIFLTNGGFVKLPYDGDKSATNELQALSFSNDTIFLTNGGFVKIPPASAATVLKDNELAVINETGAATAPATVPNVALAGVGAGNVDNGVHSYKITFVTSTGETNPSPISDSVTVVFNGTDGKISLTSLPISTDTGVTGRKIYRRFHPAGTDYKLVTTISNNTTTSYIDSLAYISLGVIVPLANNTETRFKFDASQLTQNRTFTMPDKSGTVALIADVNNSIPSGVIVMWSGALLSIPSGWALCDGTNGTPDLRNKFILGTDTAENPGGIGGTNSHSHIVPRSKVDWRADTDYSPLAQGTSGSSYVIGRLGTQQRWESAGSWLAGDRLNQFNNWTTSTGGNSIVGNWTAFTQDTTITDTILNIPPYFKLALIMKL